ncbi:MAG TPA: hypothetical protein VEA80_08900 [Vitreimonas sp.]|uniref:hypothetical protein n=1 Tax=Vitreimonas sp. TaxID=3069702 RepID=UPI002D51D91D|nr:hypothetical protein [Vitreimonas sp.]HYD87578.1 hypothetical protein [Vitreimonas sp.]
MLKAVIQQPLEILIGLILAAITIAVPYAVETGQLELSTVWSQVITGVCGTITGIWFAQIFAEVDQFEKAANLLRPQIAQANLSLLSATNELVQILRRHEASEVSADVVVQVVDAQTRTFQTALTHYQEIVGSPDMSGRLSGILMAIDSFEGAIEKFERRTGNGSAMSEPSDVADLKQELSELRLHLDAVGGRFSNREAVTIKCPKCPEMVGVYIGRLKGNTAHARCPNRHKFPVHRAYDGSVFVGGV